MEAYKTPVSDVEVTADGEFRPVRAVIYGLLITVVLGVLVSMIEGIVFVVLSGGVVASDAALAAALAASLPFLLTDLVLSLILLYVAGMVVRKYAVNQEIKFGLIVCGITLAVFVPIFISSDGHEIYPLWYNIISFLSIPVALMAGAKPRKS